MLGRIIGRLLDALPGEGAKTYVAGIALILVGAAGLLMHFAQPDSQYALPVDQAIQMILTGAAAIGIGHKIDRANTGAGKPPDTK